MQLKMTQVLKSAIILSLGLTIIVISVEAVKIRCYGKSLTDFSVHKLDEIQNLVNSQFFTKNASNKLIVHGFKGDPNEDFVTNITMAYIRARSTPPSVHNVLVLDWSEEARANSILGDELSYVITGAYQARSLGEQSADAIAKIANLGFNVSLTYVIGHSLGAHLAGYCGRRLITLYNLVLARIYGMDPSGPWYEGFLPLNTPLKKGSALRVFCLHSDPGNIGINSSNCNIDAWVNYGLFLSSNKTERVQPGCPEGNFSKASIEGRCSHDFGWKLFNASLEHKLSDSFQMRFANNYWEWARSTGTAAAVIKLTEKNDIINEGNFYFSANGSWPYGLHDSGLKPVYDHTNITSYVQPFSIFDMFYHWRICPNTK